MELRSNSPDETRDIGFKLGKLLNAGDIVGLYGDLGSGKTTMAKGIANAFGINSRDIASASFTIIAEYPGNPDFYHIDLYRINRGMDIEGTGIWDCMGSRSVSVIEWAERLEGLLPDNTIRVHLEDRGNELRTIIIEGIDEQNWNNLQT